MANVAEVLCPISEAEHHTRFSNNDAIPPTVGSTLQKSAIPPTVPWPN